ncbi:SDR family NAD(P)-dependent oxidoreductase [Iodidimonas sp. SYSU 1G8]|uniref:SDR family NAD(P)-dependent oxidoreductase n=1 Tax=Iodidimonas sp. SYSU 1G8 TaxID=3133967 RepID=UPI0031FE83CA
MEQLNGRVAVITGGASGIGLATARRFADEGMKLVLADIEQASLDRAVAEFRDRDVPVIGLRTDVGERAQVQALADAAWDAFGAVHVLFNNAGVAVYGPVQEMKHEDWEWSIRVNLWGVIHGVEAFVQRMLDQDEEGHIVSTASFAGLVPNSGLGVYCVTKYGVVALSECLYRDLRGTKLSASVLCPMLVKTNIGDSARNRPEELGGSSMVRKRNQEEQESLQGRTLQAPEVADRVLRAIKRRELYIITHEESREFVRRRFERIDRSFDAVS